MLKGKKCQNKKDNKQDQMNKNIIFEKYKKTKKKLILLKHFFDYFCYVSLFSKTFSYSRNQEGFILPRDPDYSNFPYRKLPWIGNVYTKYEKTKKVNNQNCF